MGVMTYFAKGWRSMVTPYNGFLLSYTAASMLVLSAYDSSISLQVDNWRELQSRYNGQLKVAIKKVTYMDGLMKDQAINNAQTTVSRIFNTPQYQSTKTYNQSLWNVYQTVNSTYTDYHWIMMMKMAKPPQPSTANSYYFNCFNCFSVVDPSNDYEFLIAGVPTGSTPNTKYLQQKAFFTESNKYPYAKDLANSIFNGFCLAGIQAISMYEDLADIYPTEWNGVSERTNDPGTITIRFWSYQEDCALYFTEESQEFTEIA
jgi:hypothetical protein